MVHGGHTFAKVYTTILDSSLAEDWQVRHVFEDMLKLCDADGLLDMTHESFARRTNVPIEIVRRAIDELEKPDPRSRTPDFNGVRIVRIDEHRDWGWHIVNYSKFRMIASEEQRKESQRKRFRTWKEKNSGKSANASLTPTNIALTSPSASASVSASAFDPLEGCGEPLGEVVGPKVEDALKWLARAKENAECDYTDAETRYAFLRLKANGFKWGQADWMAALEHQIQWDRKHDPKHKWQPKSPESNQRQENIKLNRL